MLRVKGDTMTGAAITHGDLVVVRQQQVPETAKSWPPSLTGAGPLRPR
jgi:hypothetical protein